MEQLERLKEIQLNNLRQGYNNILTHDDFAWLLQTIEQLQQENEGLKKEIKVGEENEKI